MKIKTSELIGPALDWAVAKCEGLPLRLDPMDFRGEAPGAVQSGWWVWPGPCAMIIGYTPRCRSDHEGYSPSTDWAQGGPIIHREMLGVFPSESASGKWCCRPREKDYPRFPITYADTPLIAAMRCYVASKLGDEVDVPEELA
jgi:hypothetical protein